MQQGTFVKVTPEHEKFWCLHKLGWSWNEENCNWSIARTSIYTLTFFKKDLACLYHLSPTSMVRFKWTFLCRKLAQKLVPCLNPKLIQPGIIHGLKDGKLSYPFALNPSKCIRTMESSAFVQYLAPSETLCVSGHFVFVRPRIGWGTFAATLYKWFPVESWWVFRYFFKWGITKIISQSVLLWCNVVLLWAHKLRTYTPASSQGFGFWV